MHHRNLLSYVSAAFVRNGLCQTGYYSHFVRSWSVTHVPLSATLTSWKSVPNTSYFLNPWWILSIVLTEVHLILSLLKLKKLCWNYSNEKASKQGNGTYFIQFTGNVEFILHDCLPKSCCVIKHFHNFWVRKQVVILGRFFMEKSPFVVWLSR